MGRRPRFKSPTGMHDVLPEDQKYFRKIYSVAENIANFYGFKKIDTPLVEETDLFLMGIGVSTDIVTKQMYSFRTKGGDSLTLRPEFTAGIVRAYIEHGMSTLPHPLKLYTFGPLFRYERPQAGRFRQFHQFDFEVFDEGSSVIDVQIIQIFYSILKELGLKNLIIEINNIGDNQCRPYYKKMLVNYLRSRKNSLCADCKRRLRENPLRILDCKEEKCQQTISQAPQMIDQLCKECHLHFKEVLEFLDGIDLPYRLNPYLVRGLDYYTKTVFEIFSEDKVNSSSDPKSFQKDLPKNALAGGGRFDGLIKMLRGKDAPAMGAAAGIERIVAEMKAKEEGKFLESPSPKIFLAQLGILAKMKSLRLLEDFRKAKIQVAESIGRDSLKSQLNRANKIGARYTLILGQKESLEETIVIRDMKAGSQKIVKIEEVVEEVKKRLKK